MTFIRVFQQPINALTITRSRSRRLEFWPKSRPRLFGGEIWLCTDSSPRQKTSGFGMTGCMSLEVRSFSTFVLNGEMFKDVNPMRGQLVVWDKCALNAYPERSDQHKHAERFVICTDLKAFNFPKVVLAPCHVELPGAIVQLLTQPKPGTCPTASPKRRLGFREKLPRLLRQSPLTTIQ